MAVAAAAVNQFQTITHVVGINTVGIYTAPTGYTGVVLLAQVTITDSVTKTEVLVIAEVELIQKLLRTWQFLQVILLIFFRESWL